MDEKSSSGVWVVFRRQAVAACSQEAHLFFLENWSGLPG